MTLPALSLDDLTYEDLRELAMRNIPAASGGRWTHHAPVDAGITLLELFAFLLEQQLFVLDQVPDAMVGALLALLDEAPRPTRAARTLLVRGEGGATAFELIDTAEAFRPTSAALADLVFTATEPGPVLLPPVAALGTSVDGADVSAALGQKRAVPLLANLGEPGRIEFAISLKAPFAPGHVGKTLALALILEGTGVAPEWAMAAVDVPAPSAFTLNWRAGAEGGEIASVEDGTGGLRRSGLIRFPVPAAFAGHADLTLQFATARVGHARPPHLTAVYLGAATAEHRWHRSIRPADSKTPANPLWSEFEAAFGGWLPVSGQTLDLPQALTPVFEDTIMLRLLDRDGADNAWTPAADLTPLSPEDRRFIVDRATSRLSFGDGYNGRVPAPATPIALSVDLGGGFAGNHAAGLDWRRLADDPAELRLCSAVDAIDGAEAETLAEARARVASSLAERHRAVTEADYVGLVETAPGIGPHRAHVAVGYDPNFPCRYIPDSVSVFVVPRTGLEIGAPRADDGALAKIRARLDAARMLTTRIFVLRPRFRPVVLDIALSAGAGDSTSFTVRLRPVFVAYFHSAEGGPEATGWPFGRALRPSELVRVAQEALGTDAVIDRISIRLGDEGRGAEACTDVAIGTNDLVFLAGLRARMSAPTQAGATL